MKNRWTSLGLGAAIGLATICNSYAMEAIDAKLTATTDGFVVVQDVRGKAEYSYDGNSWRPLASGKLLKAGAVVRSSSSGTVTLRMDDLANFVRVTPNTSLQLVPSPLTKEATQSSAPVARNGSAKIRSLRGKASIIESGERRDARVNSVLSPGATVITEEKTKMDLFFPQEGLVVRMQPRTIMKVRAPETATAPTDTNTPKLRLSVARGAVEVNHRTYLATNQ